MRILAWCLMRNHWHFVVWPREEGEVTAHFRWLAHTHAMRWHVAHGTVGRGHLYQGRFKSFPVEEDEHFLTVCRYVERNALTAGVVDACGGLALGQPLGTASWRRAIEGDSQRLADRAAGGLGEPGERADDREGSGSDPHVHCQEPPVWKRGVARRTGQTSGLGPHLASAKVGPGEQEQGGWQKLAASPFRPSWLLTVAVAVHCPADPQPAHRLHPAVRPGWLNCYA